MAKVTSAKKVYVVTSGTYSDYHITAIFSTNKRAKEYVLLKNGSESYSDYRVEVYTLDELAPILDTGIRTFSFHMDREGNLVLHEGSELPKGDIPEDLHPVFSCHVKSLGWTMGRTTGFEDTRFFKVQARDLQGAIKIANEQRSQMLAMDTWTK